MTNSSENNFSNDMDFVHCSQKESSINPEYDTLSQEDIDDQEDIVRLEYSKDTQENKLDKNSKQWLLAGASVIGNMHLEKGIPCQDNHKFQAINDMAGVAVICDGAGSKEHSDKGSKIVSEKACEWLCQQYELNPDRFLEQKELQNLSNELYEYLYKSLEQYAEDSKLNFDSLGCTLIAVIYQPSHLSCIHIGDGRAAYQDVGDKEWKHLIEPWNTEEGYTVFVTTNAVKEAPAPREEYIRCCITGSVSAFAIMSDGCENTSFECLIFDKDKQKYIKPNRPFPKFFNPVKETLVKVHQHFEDDQKAINAVWEQFLKDGTPQLAKEPDDKTMIFAINSVFLD